MAEPTLATGDPGFPAPDGDTRLCLTIHGAIGRSYVDRTKKVVDVCIKRGDQTNQTVLFSHQYNFVGSDLSAHVEWSSTNAATLFFYDYGDGVSQYDLREKPTPSNQIATVSFYLDKQTGKFKQRL